MRPAIGKCVCVKNLFIKQLVFEHAGDVHEYHSHVFDHPTLVARGSVVVETDDGKKVPCVAGDIILVKANKMHRLVATEDNTMACCLHVARRDETGEPEDILEGIIVTENDAEMGVICNSLVNGQPNGRFDL